MPAVVGAPQGTGCAEARSPKGCGRGQCSRVCGGVRHILTSERRLSSSGPPFLEYHAVAHAPRPHVTSGRPPAPGRLSLQVRAGRGVRGPRPTPRPPLPKLPPTKSACAAGSLPGPRARAQGPPPSERMRTLAPNALPAPPPRPNLDPPISSHVTTCQATQRPPGICRIIVMFLRPRGPEPM